MNEGLAKDWLAPNKNSYCTLSFYSRELILVDPVHKLPRTLFLVSNFLNLEVEEFSFYALDSSPE